jgi:outer membrane autotransporter protein
MEISKNVSNVGFGGAHARASYLLGQSGGWYVKPLIDLDATYLSFGGFSESGGGAANLNVQSNDAWVLSASPAVEVGGDFKTTDGTVLRPFVRSGVTFYNDTDFALTSSFLEAPVGVAPFTVTSKFDNWSFDVSAGIDLLSIDGIEMKLAYDGRFSGNSEMHAGSGKVGVKF